MLKREHLKGIDLLAALFSTLVVGDEGSSLTLWARRESCGACPGHAWAPHRSGPFPSPAPPALSQRPPHGGRGLAAAGGAGGASLRAVLGLPLGGNGGVRQSWLRPGREAGVAPMRDPGAGTSRKNTSCLHLSPPLL